MILDESPPVELTPVKDQSNKCAKEKSGRKNSSGTSWYGRLSPGSKEQYLRKQRQYRELKRLKSLEEPKQLPEQGSKHTTIYCLNLFTGNLPLFIHLVQECSQNIAFDVMDGVSPSLIQT